MAKSYVTAVLATAMLALLGVAPAQGQPQQTPPQPAPQQAASTSDEIVVIGQARTEDAVRAFVHQLSVAPRNVNQLGRWTNTVCTGVAGLQTRFAQFLNDRIAQRAEAVGIDIGDPGCRANVLIVVSASPDAIAHELVDGHENRMGVLYQRGRTSLGRTALTAFVHSTAPVRWWHVNHTATQDGDPIGETSDGGPAIQELSGGATRIHRSTHQMFGAAYVIVDARQLQGVSFEALADYLAMVTLAQLSSDADTSGFPTILNLFAARAQGHTMPTAMTDWDVAYLHGLYGATQDARNAQTQEGEITRSMATQH